MPSANLTEIWVYLSASPLLGLTITLIAYSLAYRLYRTARYSPLLNPVVTSVATLILFLSATRTPYPAYFEGGQFVHFLLGPATVALAVPLYQQFAKLKTLWLPVAIAILTGSSVGALSAVFLARLLGASTQTQLSLAPKSVTTPVAMGISEQIGGLPSLTAALVVTTGVMGALGGTTLLRLLRIKNDSVKGITMGVTAHGIGTARSFQVSSEMGAFSGLGMALSALTTAVMLPWLLNLMQ
ncbi:LrgB family protein [Acaryochloris sp. IP29b_bin.148]|uniref:LrgB family protein n=1 Tax=Acaryochloris sp. IP29b_bin.148 TaxID=2969218 RepID=UPI00261F932C|nr:LrgB family protein [Acaryochloris sp. IP29b_bin.148]